MSVCLVWLEQLSFLEPVVDTLEEEEEEEDESVERISKFHQITVTLLHCIQLCCLIATIFCFPIFAR